MRWQRFLIGLSCSLVSLAMADGLRAAGGTSIVASKGSPTYENPAWPAGVVRLLGEPQRTTGWNPWFSEWPNDVNHYAFEVETTEDVNRLLQMLAETRSDLRQVRLSPHKEPRGLGWVTNLPEGNNIPVIFSIGDQTRIDQWYGRLRQPFGLLEFNEAPVAVPPTLTLFIQHQAIDLNRLKIPAGIAVTAGGVPTLFHNANMKQRPDEPQAASIEPPKLDEATQAALDQITTFLETRAEVAPKD
jgi:hypothetical protein